jgi:hypothetical protein
MTRKRAVPAVDPASLATNLKIRWPKRRRGQSYGTSADVIAAVHQLVLIAKDDLIRPK